MMKVYHDRGPSDYDPPDREVNLFACESNAYRRLKAKGLCERGVVPDFYGTITKIQPSLWPNLHIFLGDKLPPNAVLIEYIPNMQPIDFSNFSKQYLLELRHILHDIHQGKGSPRRSQTEEYDDISRTRQSALDRFRFCTDILRGFPIAKTRNLGQGRD